MQLTTPRLILRPINKHDANEMFQYRSDPATSQYLSFIPTSISDIEEFIAQNAKEPNLPGTWFQLAITEKETQQLIGDIGLHFLNDGSNNQQVEIGYTLSRNFRGKGYAIEALREVINYLFRTLNKHRIIASIDPINPSSIKVAERLGFRKEAHFVKSLFFQGRWVDDVIYAMLSQEWNESD